MGKFIQCGDDVSLTSVIAEIAPRSIWMIGPKVEPVVTQYLVGNALVALKHSTTDNWPEAIAAGEQFDFVFLSRVLENMRKPIAAQWIAQLRQHCPRFYVKVPLSKAWLNHASFWELNDLRSLGMDLVNLTAERGLPVGIFRYDAKTYKTDAEWLSSKYWAQPD